MKRNASIDFARGVGIIAVTLGHILGSYQIKSGLFIWVYSFELPLFFLVSGTLSSSKAENVTSREYIRKQVRNILFPYLGFSVIYILINILAAIINQHSADMVRLLIVDCGYTLSGLGLGALWFLPTFFLAKIISDFFLRFRMRGGVLQKINICAATCILACILAWLSEKYGYIYDFAFLDDPLMTVAWNGLSLIARCMVGVSLILIGNLLGLSRDWFQNIVNTRKKTVILSVVLIGLGACLGLLQGQFVDLHFAFIRNPILFYLSAISSTFGLLALGTVWVSKSLNWLGQNSLYIMFCQIIQQYFCRMITKLVDMNAINNILKYTVVFMSLVIIIALAVGVTVMMKKYGRVQVFGQNKEN